MPKNNDDTETVFLQLGQEQTAKITVTLPSFLVKELKTYAESNEMSLSRAVLQAIELDKFIREALEEGGAIYLQDKDGRMVKVELLR